MRFSLQQFDEVLQTRNANGQPYVLIGGQAVNYWAERYLSIEPELKELMPFTSEDIDFKGEREDVKRIAEQLHLMPQYPHRVEMTALAGFIIFRVDGVSSNIEIVRKIPGVSGSVENLAITAESAGRQIRVLDPISLFSCKLELATKVSQKNRRDVEHLKILVPCVRAFLREFLEQVTCDGVPIKGWLGAANKVMKLTGAARMRKLARRFGTNWPELLPWDEIVASKHGKIILFRERQPTRWLARQRGVSD